MGVATINIIAHQGDSFGVRFVTYGDVGMTEAVSPHGRSFQMEAVKVAGLAKLPLTVETDGSAIIITATATDMNVQGGYLYELKETRPDGAIRTLAGGKIEVKSSIYNIPGTARPTTDLPEYNIQLQDNGSN